VWQLLQDGQAFAFKINVEDVLAMVGHVLLYAVYLTLMHYSFYTAGCQGSCLVQPAVGPGSTEQAARVITAVAQHQKQAVAWQLQQSWLWLLGDVHPA
jgi:hypothetical protein